MATRTTKPAAKKKTKKPTRSAKKRVKAVAKKSERMSRPRSSSEVAVDRLRKICLALPETTEVQAWGEPTFRVKDKIFAMHSSGGTHHGERQAVWILSIGIEQDFVIRSRPDRYFKPPYVGPSGWIGAYLDKNPPWAEIEELIKDGWRRRAPKKVAALLPE